MKFTFDTGARKRAASFLLDDLRRTWATRRGLVLTFAALVVPFVLSPIVSAATLQGLLLISAAVCLSYWLWQLGKGLWQWGKEILVAIKIEAKLARSTLAEFSLLAVVAVFIAVFLVVADVVSKVAAAWLVVALPASVMLARHWWRRYR